MSQTNYGELLYWVDDFGQLWRGPSSPNENLHYATFEGYTITTQHHEPIWVMRRSDAPSGPRFEQISSERARKVMELFRQEAIAEKRRRAS